MDHVSEWIIKIPVLLFAITIHEYAHGRTALYFGDPTARSAGRLSFNPLIHMDPFGAICLFLFNFGWAKPVPVNPRYFGNPRRDSIFVSLNGPLANLAAAFLTGMLIRWFMLPYQLYLELLFYMILMNIGLAIFNILPIPPLDGSHVLENILPPKASLQYRQLGRYAPVVLILILLLDNFAHLGILSRLLGYPLLYLARLFGGDNFFVLIRMVS